MFLESLITSLCSRTYNRTMQLRRSSWRISGTFAGRVFALGMSLAFLCPCAFTQHLPTLPQAQDLRRTIPLPIPEWLSQGERTEIPWTVALSDPVLTFQLRTVVRVTAKIDAKLLQKQGVMHQLHFIVKAAAENGEWDDEESYSSIKIDGKLVNTELQMLADLYLQPGAYRVATIVYDAISKKRNVSFSRVQISAPDRDWFPGLLTGIPKITLLPPPDSTAPFAPERVFLPVATERPIQLDLIVDLSAHEKDYEPAGSLLLPSQGQRVF